MRAVEIINPYSTDHENSSKRVALFEETYGISEVSRITQESTPEIIQEKFEDSSGQTLFYVDGGDGTVRGAVRALIGFVPNQPDATKENIQKHTEIANRAVLFAAAGGNANNWAVSANDSQAKNPTIYPSTITEFRPLEYTVVDENGDHVASNLCIGSLGFGAGALAAQRIQQSKPMLNGLPKRIRLFKEAEISLRAIANSPSLDLATTSDKKDFEHNIKGVTGIEFIGSQKYAKIANTNVKIDDTFWQPLISVGDGRPRHNLMNGILRTSLALSMKRFGLPKVDLNDNTITLTHKSKEDLAFHSDGEIDQYIQRGQSLILRLSDIAVPTIALRQYK